MTTPSMRLFDVLADAAEPGRPFNPGVLLDLDEHDTFPADACALLDEFGLARYYLPRTAGGLLDDFAEFVRLIATVAHHDLTVAIAHGKTFLGVVSIWVAGSQAQLRRWGSELADGAVVSWGLTERGHGSDLLAGELTATRTEGGWRLQGEKWAINNATRGDALCVLARTSDRGAAGGFSLVLVDKREIFQGRYTCLPKLRTYGIRGADISGIAFHGTQVPADSLVGQEGAGIATVLKALQLTRIATAGLSLGAVQHALDVLRSLRMRGAFTAGPVPVPDTGVARLIGRTMATANVVSAVAAVAARSVHTLPGELSVISAITKAFVPSLVDELFLELSEVIGDLTDREDSLPARIYRKLERDHRIVGIFDGSTTVSRQALIAQFPMLARFYAKGTIDHDGLDRAVDVDGPLPPVRVDRLEMMSRTGCSLVQSVPGTLARIREIAESAGWRGERMELVERVGALIEDVMAEIAQYQPRRQAPARAFELAAAYELGFAAAACLRVWLASAHTRDWTWLHSALTLLVSKWDGVGGEQSVFEELARATEQRDPVVEVARTDVA